MMAGHGSPPADDKANHPGRQVSRPHQSGDALFDELMDQANTWDAEQKDKR